MTAYLVLVAAVVAAVAGIWLIWRSRQAPPGTNGVDPSATRGEPAPPRKGGSGHDAV